MEQIQKRKRGRYSDRASFFPPEYLNDPPMIDASAQELMKRVLYQSAQHD
jgi:hypothetical protein